MKKATPPTYDPGPWRIVIEPLTGFMPFGRWRIYLAQGFMIYGLDSWGWTRFTLRGARRKGERELTRMERQEARELARARIADNATNGDARYMPTTLTKKAAR
jgi:hypothetical protein